MTGKQFVDYVRLRTRTNSTTLSNTDLLLLANVRMDTIAAQIMGAEEDTLVLPFTTNLLLNQRQYAFTSNILSRIKYVEAKLDGTNFIHLSEMDLNQYKRTTDETTITSNFSNYEGHAFYDIYRKALYLYSGSVTAVTGGLKLWCNTYPAPLDVSRIADDTTDLSTDPTAISHGFPRELHELWARGTIIDFKESRQKPIPLTEREMSYKVDLMQAVFDLKHGNMDRVVMAATPPASDRGNNGANY